MQSLPLDPRAGDWIRLFADVAELSAPHTDARVALSMIAELVRQSLGSCACTLARVDPAHGQPVIVTSAGPDAAFADAVLGWRMDVKPVGAIGLGAPPPVLERHHLQDVANGFAPLAVAQRYQLQSVVCQPIARTNGEVLGYLSHFSSANEPFSERTRELLTIFAQEAKAVIERAEWHLTFERSVTALNALSRNLLATEQGFLTQVAEATRDLLAVPVCIVWQRAEQEQKLRVAATAGPVDETFKAIDLNLEDPGVQLAVASKDVKWLRDVRTSNAMYGHRLEAEERGWVSLLCAPMLVGHRLIGMLDVYTTSVRHFERWEKELFAIFANQAALSIATFDSRRKLEALNDLMREVIEAPDIDEVLAIFLNGALNYVGAVRGWISRLDLRTGDLDIQHHVGGPRLQRLRHGEGITGTAIVRGKPINAGDVSAPEWRNTYVPFWHDTRSELAIPIMVCNAEVRDGTTVLRGPKPIGVINLESTRPNAFSDISTNILWSLAQQVATVIEKLELDARLAKLEKTERHMGQLGTYDETARTVLEAVNALGYDFVNISLVRPESGRIGTEYVLGLPADRVEEFKQMADHPLDGDDIQAHVVRNAIPEVPRPDDRRFDQDIFKEFRHNRLIRVFVPMRLPQAGRVIGTIEAGYSQAYRRHIYERDVNMLQGFADYAALVLEHKRLASLDFFFPAVLRTALAAVGATQGSLLMLNRKSGFLEVLERWGRPFAPGNVQMRIGEGIAGIAVRDCQSMRIPDILEEPRFVRPRHGDGPTFRSMLVVPIISGGEALGAICAHDEAVDRFTEADEAQLQAEAKQAASSIGHQMTDALLGHTRSLNQLQRFRGVAEELGRLTRDLPALRQHITDAAVSLLHADPVLLYEYHEDTGAFEPRPTIGGKLHHPDAVGGEVRPHHAPYAIVIKQRSHYSDASRHDAFLRSHGPTPGADGHMVQPFVDREYVVASAGIVLKAGKEVVGVLFLNYREPHEFSPHDKHIIDGFAVDVAHAIQEARKVRDVISTNRRMALEENRAVVAHRLKGPLIAMKRRLSEIQKASDPSQVRRLAAQAAELNRHVQDVIANFNVAGRPPSRAHQSLSGDQLAELLTTALEVNRTRDDTDIAVHVDPDLPAMLADRDALIDDVVGFLHDSERHCVDRAAVRVDVSAAADVDKRNVDLPVAQPFIKLIYRDNGPGIRPTDKERVFDASYTTTPDGTGLGLAIARRNAQLHGGALRECGTYGQGVAFEMYLRGDAARKE